MNNTARFDMRMTQPGLSQQSTWLPSLLHRHINKQIEEMERLILHGGARKDDREETATATAQ
eukprot:1024911-Ditylum_brightwellii.AAC.1